MRIEDSVGLVIELALLTLIDLIAFHTDPMFEE